jgi:hypothetical protein
MTIIAKYLAIGFFPHLGFLAGLVALSFILLETDLLHGQEQPTDSSRILEVASPKWMEYSERLQFFSGDVATESKSADFSSSEKFTVKGNAACALIIGKNLLWGYNPGYAFKLKRKNEDANWAIELLDLQKEKHKNNLEREIRKGPLHSLRNIITVGPTNLPDLFSRKTFVIKKATRITYRDRNAVEIEFDNKHPLNEAALDFCPAQSGKIVLDSGGFWLILSATISVEYSDSHGNTNEETEYKYDAGGFPIPIRRVSTRDLITEKGEKLVQTFTKKWNLREGSAPDDDCTLSSVGLPEPMGMPAGRRGVSWYVWLGSTALGVLFFGSVTAVFVKRYFRRHQPEPTLAGAKET